MRTIGVLATACLLVACGQVTSVDNHDGSDDRPATGSGGTSGTGGSNSSGGSTGTGSGGSNGSGGSGGASGTGGSNGSGGAHGSGGAPGSGGSNGSGGSSGMDAATDTAATCDGYIAEYDVAFKEAKVCNPLLKSLQCQATASPSLPCSGCISHVQSTTKLDAIRAKWDAAGCKGRICPAIACILPGTGACVANDGGGGGGTCTDDHLATTN